MTREKAEKRFASLGKALFDLQDAMFGAKVHSVLVVLQGRDGAGKDGSIKHVVGCLNPRGGASRPSACRPRRSARWARRAGPGSRPAARSV